MRKEFAKFLHNEMSVNEDIHLLTGDLGYGLWDKIKLDHFKKDTSHPEFSYWQYRRINKL